MDKISSMNNCMIIFIIVNYNTKFLLAYSLFAGFEVNKVRFTLPKDTIT